MVDEGSRLWSRCDEEVKVSGEDYYCGYGPRSII